MIITTCILPPEINQRYNRSLLSTPIFRFDADYLLKMANKIYKQIVKGQFKSFSKRKRELILMYNYFMELYGRAKIEEGKNKEKTNGKTSMFFYRTRLPKQDDRTIFNRLERKL